MTAEQLAGLASVLYTIQRRSKIVYEAQGDLAFAMDVEFRIDAGGGLIVKQARPWVD